MSGWAKYLSFLQTKLPVTVSCKEATDEYDNVTLRGRGAHRVVEIKNHTEHENVFDRVRSDLGDVDKDQRLNFRIFHNHSAEHLASEVSAALNKPTAKIALTEFADGETAVKINADVSGQSLYLIASGSKLSSSSLHRAIMETLLTISAMRRAGAAEITAVLPYFPYFRQHGGHMDFNSDANRIPAASADMCLLMKEMGVDRLITMDAHDVHLEGSLPDSKPVSNLNFRRQAALIIKKRLEGIDYGNVEEDNVSGIWESLCSYFRGNCENNISNLSRPKKLQVVVCANNNRLIRPAESMSLNLEQLGVRTSSAVHLSYENLFEHVHDGSESRDEEQYDSSAGLADVKFSKVCGDVEGKVVVMVDDIIDSGKSACRAAKALKDAGARDIFFVATHILESEDCVKRLTESVITEVICTNSLSLNLTRLDPKFTVVRIGKLIAEAIYRTHNNIHWANITGY